MSSLAQEESRSISENVTWGQRKRFADGKVTVPFVRIYGNQLPILAPIYVIRVIIHLRLVAGLLLLMVCADAGIARNLPLIPAV